MMIMTCLSINLVYGEQKITLKSPLDQFEIGLMSVTVNENEAASKRNPLEPRLGDSFFKRESLIK